MTVEQSKLLNQRNELQEAIRELLRASNPNYDTIYQLQQNIAVIDSNLESGE